MITDLEKRCLSRLWNNPPDLKQAEQNGLSSQAAKILSGMKLDFDTHGELDLTRIYSDLGELGFASVLAEISSPPETADIGIETFPEMSLDDLTAALGSTIKNDDQNKGITFLACLAAYSLDSQLNLVFNSTSSSGKSYITLEVAAYFPKEDVISIGHCSPTAFFHDKSDFDEAVGGYRLDLSRKIIIFLDQPQTLLLQYLRPLLSHDQREISIRITDKSQKHGLRTKNVFIKGFPTVIFCTANLKLDEQEATRAFLLSPQTDPEKIRAAITAKILKESDPEKFRELIESDPMRKTLKRRILAVKAAGIEDIKIDCPSAVSALFLERRGALKPKHMRDVHRFMSLMKACALLNLWTRKIEGRTLFANGDDFEMAFRLWEPIAESQELNLPPYVFQFFKEVIEAAFNGEGLSRGQIIQKHLAVYSRPVPDWQLRQQILPMLESAGLIIQDSDPKDSRRKLVWPTKNYSESRCGGEI